MKKNTNMPEAKFRAGPVATTIWRNQVDKNGETVEYRTISFERSYKDKDGKWNTTNHLRVNDLPRAQLVLQKAYEFLVLKEKDDAIPEEVIA
jgi:hypothetical protein